MNAIGLVVGSWLLAEFYGYWLHILLHSDKVRWLSDNHMSHHLRSYPPVGRPIRTDDYIQDVMENQKMVLGLGAEWYLPGAVLIGTSVLLEWLIGLSWAQIGLSVGGMLTYSVFMFWYLHDRMHIKGIWLSKSRITRGFFKRQRTYHDIHHYHISDKGLMTKNFGISTPIFDHVFGTYEPKIKKLNRRGIKAAFNRYGINPPLSIAALHDTPSDASENRRTHPAE